MSSGGKKLFWTKSLSVLHNQQFLIKTIIYNDSHVQSKFRINIVTNLHNDFLF